MTVILNRIYWMTCAVMALLLTIVALTGSIQAYYYEIDEWLNPAFYQVSDNGPVMHPADLIQKFEQDVPNVEVWYQQVASEPGKSNMLAVSPKQNSDTELEYNYYYIDPTSGEIIGARNWGECCFEPENFVNYTYELHHSLTIPGSLGSQLLGLVACLWVLICIILLIRALVSKKGVQFLKLSMPMTIVVTIIMLPLAVSSVTMNFSEEVFKPIISIFSPIKPSVYEDFSKKEQEDFGERRLTYKNAYNIARMIGAENKWPLPIGELFYSHTYNFYGMAFGYRDPSGMGNNWLYLSAEDGSIVGEKTPRLGTAGDKLYFSQLAIHSGRGLGSITQLFVFFSGLLIAWLSIRLLIHAIRILLGCKSSNKAS